MIYRLEFSGIDCQAKHLQLHVVRDCKIRAEEKNISTDRDPPLERYARILEVLASFPQGSSAAEIGKILNLPRATAHRLLKKLENSRLVDLTKGNAYELGERVRQLIFLGADMKWMDPLVRPVLHRLAISLDETCYISKLDQNRIVSIMMESPNEVWSGFVRPGRDLPPHAAAGAKAILAYQPSDTVERVLTPDLPKLTRFTKTSINDVQTEYQEIRSQGYATCIGEIVEELVAIAIPISVVDSEYTDFSLGLTGPRSRVTTKRFLKLVQDLIPVAQQIGHIIAKGETLQIGIPTE